MLGAAAQGPRAARVSGWLFLFAGVTVCGLIMANRRALIQQYGALDGPLQIALALVLIVVRARNGACARSRSCLPAVAVLSARLRVLRGTDPGRFGHGGMPVDYLLGTLTITEGGLWGTLTGTSVDTIAMFVIPRRLHLGPGRPGQGFMAFATQLGGADSGPGRPRWAILFPRPSMARSRALRRRTPHHRHDHHSVEVKRLGLPAPAGRGDRGRGSSTGGQILPPSWGQVSFVMAELVRVPYTEIMVAALLPSDPVLPSPPGSACMSTRCASTCRRCRSAMPGWAGPFHGRSRFFLLPLLHPRRNAGLHQKIIEFWGPGELYPRLCRGVRDRGHDWATLVFESPTARCSRDPAGTGERGGLQRHASWRSSLPAQQVAIKNRRGQIILARASWWCVFKT